MSKATDTHTTIVAIGRRLHAVADQHNAADARDDEPAMAPLLSEEAFLRVLPRTIRRAVCAPLLVPFKVSVRALRERNVGNHADKTSPRCSMGCRGRAKSASSSRRAVAARVTRGMRHLARTGPGPRCAGRS